MKLLLSNYFYMTILIMFVFISCIPIDYIGDTYPPTDKVDVYYSEKEVKINYIIFGHIIGSKASINDIKEKLQMEAMKRGADAILFTKVDFEDSDGSRTRKLSASLIKYQK
jgi:hypothetical protein